MSCPSLAQVWAITGELYGSSGGHAMVVVVAIKEENTINKQTLGMK